MKKHERELKEQDVLKDVVCDSCGKSCDTEYGFEFMQMSATWGFDSKKDMQKWDAQLCEECVDKHMGFVKFQKQDAFTGRKL